MAKRSRVLKTDTMRSVTEDLEENLRSFNVCKAVLGLSWIYRDFTRLKHEVT